jgi:GT2 family glycosyltransferase
MNPKVSIIILNWNGWEDTIECLESLYQMGWKEKELENMPSNRKLILIKNEKNYGFAKGNNIGMRYALSSRTDYILILNNDIVVAPDFLTELIEVTEKDAQIGIAGPTCYYYDWPGVIWATGVRISWWTGRMRDIVGQGKQDKGQYQGIMEVDGVTGCAMLIRRQVLDKISLFDPRFPFGNEDYEFCIRARRRGQFKVIYIPNSKIWHKVSRSRRKLMSDLTERHALLGREGDLRLKSRFQFFKICSPSRLSYISQGIFYFVIALPWAAFLYLTKHGLKATIVRVVSALKDIKNLV